jgi:hypothetical protein
VKPNPSHSEWTLAISPWPGSRYSNLTRNPECTIISINITFDTRQTTRDSAPRMWRVVGATGHGRARHNAANSRQRAALRFQIARLARVVLPRLRIIRCCESPSQTHRNRGISPSMQRCSASLKIRLGQLNILIPELARFRRDLGSSWLQM